MGVGGTVGYDGSSGSIGGGRLVVEDSSAATVVVGSAACVVVDSGRSPLSSAATEEVVTGVVVDVDVDEVWVESGSLDPLLLHPANTISMSDKQIWERNRCIGETLTLVSSRDGAS